MGLPFAKHHCDIGRGGGRTTCVPGRGWVRMTRLGPVQIFGAKSGA